MLLSAPLLGTSYPPLAVWASLLPIIGGCAMSSLNEVTFSWPGFLNASASNVGMVLRNIVRLVAHHLCTSALLLAVLSMVEGRTQKKCTNDLRCSAVCSKKIMGRFKVRSCMSVVGPAPYCARHWLGPRWHAM